MIALDRDDVPLPPGLLGADFFRFTCQLTVAQFLSSIPAQSSPAPETTPHTSVAAKQVVSRYYFEISVVDK